MALLAHSKANQDIRCARDERLATAKDAVSRQTKCGDLRGDRVQTLASERKRNKNATGRKFDGLDAINRRETDRWKCDAPCEGSNRAMSNIAHGLLAMLAQ